LGRPLETEKVEALGFDDAHVHIDHFSSRYCSDVEERKSVPCSATDKASPEESAREIERKAHKLDVAFELRQLEMAIVDPTASWSMWSREMASSRSVIADLPRRAEEAAIDVSCLSG